MTSRATPARVSRSSIVVGLLVAALVAGAGAALLLTRPVQWTATASLLVLPRAVSSDDPNELASLYDALSRGQVAATYAELLRDGQLDQGAADDLELSSTDADSLELEVEVVPSTSVLDVRVSAASADVAEQVAIEVQEQAADYLSAIDAPYTAEAIGTPAGTAERDGLTPLLAGALIAIAAVTAGLAAQQAVAGVARARGGTDESETSLAPIPVIVVAPEPVATTEPPRWRRGRR